MKESGHSPVFSVFVFLLASIFAGCPLQTMCTHTSHDPACAFIAVKHAEWGHMLRIGTQPRCALYQSTLHWLCMHVYIMQKKWKESCFIYIPFSSVCYWPLRLEVGAWGVVNLFLIVTEADCSCLLGSQQDRTTFSSEILSRFSRDNLIDIGREGTSSPPALSTNVFFLLLHSWGFHFGGTKPF